MQQLINARYSSQDHYKALRDDYKTPPHIYEPLLRYFKRGKFDIDVCCTDKNIPAITHYTKAEDGLSQIWDGLCFCNPPWNITKKFVQKGLKEIERNPQTQIIYVVSSDKMYINYVQDSFLNNPFCSWLVMPKKQGFIIPGREDEPLCPSVGVMIAILSKNAPSITYDLNFYNLFNSTVFNGQKLNYKNELKGA